MVAALTIPTLMNKSQNQEFASKFKKEYSSLSNAYASIRNENADSLSGVFVSQDDAINQLCEKFICLKKCLSSDSTCTYQTIVKNFVGTKFFNINSPYQIILQDGTILSMTQFNTDCSLNLATDGLCHEVLIDVNGLKLPNQFGRDIFVVLVTKSKILPDGAIGTVDADNNDSYCDKSRTTLTYNGFTCGNKILQGSKIEY